MKEKMSDFFERNKRELFFPKPYYDLLDELNGGIFTNEDLEPESYELPRFDIMPPEGFLTDKGVQSSNPLPDCCEYHKLMFQKAEKWFKKFPNCCIPHKQLLNVSWFDKKLYEDIPLKVVRQVVYTEFLILESINSSSWYEDITDYINAIVSSFGSLPTGYGNPVGIDPYAECLMSSIRNKDWLFVKGMTFSKHKELVNYIDRLVSNEDIYTKYVQHLFLIYKKWLKIFPFSINYFKEEHDHFEKVPPLLKTFRYNQYLDKYLPVLHTETSLIVKLVDITKMLLKRAHPEELIEKGLLSDMYKHKLTIVNAKHRIKQSSLVEEYSKGERKYIKLLDKWLANEKEYFDQIVPLINSIQQTGYLDGDNENKAQIPDLEYKAITPEGEKVRGEKTILECLSGKPKFHEGEVKNLSRNKLALCYKFLKDAGFIVDNIKNGGEYGRSYRTYSQESGKKWDNSSQDHKEAFYYVVGLDQKKKLHWRQIKSLEKVAETLKQFPAAQNLIKEFIEARK